ncbi:uncharacterized membrane protein YccF (DUF307 family) [Pontibacter aydingkolensis]|uniref:Uncharacterized protein n=1 Tax=Pontibacter aydingkolensis TaxID=1911536 RepID=A0ABS7CU19_9BACT|nr:hypothetical protein [Pontibacter aydingkolensis]MBW7467300.1 hypothetical protein [Pontibacter aydingkolensis]
METTYLPFVQAGYIALTFICLAFVLTGVRKTFSRMSMPVAVANKRMLTITLVITGWLVLVSILSLTGFLSDFSSMPPKLMLLLPVPLIAILWLTFSARTRTFLRAIPASWLMYLQVFRVPVEIFLWLQFLDGLTPVQMTFEGLNWDVLTGITAPVFAYICFGQGRNLRGLAIAWNLFGLALLINIVTIALLSAPVPFRTFFNEPANTLVTMFPVSFLPLVLVPLAYALHFFSLRKLLMGSTAPESPKQTSLAV